MLIPVPPTKQEYYQYFGKQPLRILSVLLFVLSIGSVYGIYAVFTKSSIWYPFLLLLVVMVPWSIYIVILATFRPRITYDTHQRVKQLGKGMRLASVDIFLPVCGEDIGVLRNTFSCISRINWPSRLTTYVLDDGDSTSVKTLAREFGFNYLVRDDRPLHKKSGNMNNGYRMSNGQFIVVFDADFAPAPDFLTETMPYMCYSNVGIVQTTQYFDVKLSETRNWIQQLSGSVQDMFFCWAQPARMAADAGMCVGTNVVYRREALDKTDGFSKVSSGEDVITGLDLYAKGYRTAYVPLNLAKGVCPDSFYGVVNQQYRWAASSVRMFVGKNEHRKALKNCPLNLRQRLVFMSGALYYSQSILSLITMVVPSLVMLWFFPWQIGPGNYLPILPSMLGMFSLPLLIRGWRPTTLRLILVYSVAHLLAAIDAIRGSMASWEPSGSAVKTSDVPGKASFIIRSWVLISQVLTWWALAFDLPIYGLRAYWPAVLIAMFQTVVLTPLLFPGHGTIAQFSLMPHLLRKRVKAFARLSRVALNQI